MLKFKIVFFLIEWNCNGNHINLAEWSPTEHDKRTGKNNNDFIYNVVLQLIFNDRICLCLSCLSWGKYLFVFGRFYISCVKDNETVKVRLCQFGTEDFENSLILVCTLIEYAIFRINSRIISFPFGFNFTRMPLPNRNKKIFIIVYD